MSILFCSMLLFITFVSSNSAEAYDQEPVRMVDSVYKVYSDTIKFDNYIYSVERCQPIYFDQYENDSDFQEFVFETVVRDSSHYTAYYFSNIEPKANLTIYFFRKKDYSIEKIIKSLDLNDSPIFVNLSVEARFNIKYLFGESFQFIQKYEQPMQIERIPPIIKIKLLDRINQHEKNESEKYNPECTKWTLNGFYIYYDKINGYTYDSEKYTEREYYRYSFIRSDEDFHKVIVLQTEDEGYYKKNYEVFRQFCLSLKLESKENRFLTSKYDLILDKEDEESLLNEVYRTNDTTGLKYLLDRMSALSKVCEYNIMSQKPDIEQEVYSIYRKFYNPENPIHEPKMDSIIKILKSTPELYNSIKDSIYIRFLNAKYYLTQGSIDVRLVDSFSTEKNKVYGGKYPRPNNTISIMIFNNFCPVISFPGKEIIFLTENIKEMLERFLEDRSDDTGAEGLMSIAAENGITGLRQQFLENYLDIIPNYHSGGWHLITHPACFITINRELNEAHFGFRYSDSFGVCILKKENGEWKMLDAGFTGME